MVNLEWPIANILGAVKAENICILVFKFINVKNRVPKWIGSLLDGVISVSEAGRI